jgi:hypothetical protein
MYQFDDAAALERAVGGEDMKRLIADFNRDWPDVTRTRKASWSQQPSRPDDAACLLVAGVRYQY